MSSLNSAADPAAADLSLTRVTDPLELTRSVTLMNELPKLQVFYTHIYKCDRICKKGSYSLSDCMYLATHNFHFD